MGRHVSCRSDHGCREVFLGQCRHAQRVLEPPPHAVGRRRTWASQELRGGEFMRMHPVILMALMMFCEQLMGITGMFLAVPIMAAVKYFLVSADMPNVYLNPLLMLLEGDEHGPHKNFVDRHRVECQAREDAIAAEISRELSETGDSEFD